MKTSVKRGRPVKSAIDFPAKKAMKIEIARQIAAHLRGCGLTQAEASAEYKIDAAVLSNICNANLEVFTIDRLIGIAQGMGIVVNINFGE